jgi:hypothetical protein
LNAFGQASQFIPNSPGFGNNWNGNAGGGNNGIGQGVGGGQFNNFVSPTLKSTKPHPV